MEIEFKETALRDIDYFKRYSNSAIRSKIDTLLLSIITTPFTGIGKPEPLKGNLSGYWSLRINKEHRIVYMVNKNTVTIHSLRGHYNKK